MDSLSLQLPLYFLGQRDYVNGLTLLEESLAAFERTTARTVERINRFQVQNWVRSHGRLEIHPASSASKSRRTGAACWLSVDAGGAWDLLLFADADNPTTLERRDDYDRGLYIAEHHRQADGGTRARLAPVQSRRDWIRGLVEINHRDITDIAHQRRLSGNVSWAYFMRCPLPADDDAHRYVQAVYSPPREIPAKDVTFFTRTMTIDGLSEDGSCEICFFIPYT